MVSLKLLFTFVWFCFTILGVGIGLLSGGLIGQTWYINCILHFNYDPSCTPSLDLNIPINIGITFTVIGGFFAILCSYFLWGKLKNYSVSNQSNTNRLANQQYNLPDIVINQQVDTELVNLRRQLNVQGSQIQDLAERLLSQNAQNQSLVLPIQGTTDFEVKTAQKFHKTNEQYQTQIEAGSSRTNNNYAFN